MQIFFKHLARWTAFALVAALIGGCSSPREAEAPFVGQPAQKKPEARASGAISAGDQIDIFVMEDESFNGRYLVRASGYAILPKVGRVAVAGMSQAEAESSVKRALEASQLRKATVILERATVSAEAKHEEQGGLSVVLTGTVSRPGTMVVPLIQGRQPGVYDAILRAGGFARFADPSNVHILRKDAAGRNRRIKADVNRIKNGQAADIPLEDGDVIEVPEKWIGF